MLRFQQELTLATADLQKLSTLVSTIARKLAQVEPRGSALHLRDFFMPLRRVVAEEIGFTINGRKFGVAWLRIHQEKTAIGTANQTVALMREGIVHSTATADRAQEHRLPRRYRRRCSICIRFKLLQCVHCVYPIFCLRRLAIKIKAPIMIVAPSVVRLIATPIVNERGA